MTRARPHPCILAACDALKRALTRRKWTCGLVSTVQRSLRTACQTITVPLACCTLYSHHTTEGSLKRKHLGIEAYCVQAIACQGMKLFRFLWGACLPSGA